MICQAGRIPEYSDTGGTDLAEQITIRPATRQDISRLDDLYRRSYARLLAADYPPSTLVFALPVIARAQPELIASGLYFVAESGTALLGAGGWSRAMPGGAGRVPGVGYVRHLATDPDAVRKGIGTRLMTHVIGDARGAGIRVLHCKSTLTATPFYKSLGFRSIGDSAMTFGGGVAFPVTLLSLPL